MATRPETFYTRKICNYLIIRIKQLLFVQLLNVLNIIARRMCNYAGNVILVELNMLPTI